MFLPGTKILEHNFASFCVYKPSTKIYFYGFLIRS